MTFDCDYCKRPIIVLNKTGVADGPRLRPEVEKWCDGTCDSVMGRFTILEAMIERNDMARATKALEKLKKEVVEALQDRDKSFRER